MREILFRGKRIDNGEWVYGGYAVTENQVYLIYNQAHSIDLQGFTVDENTIGQYTGLTDKNGKKIFEGDIVIYDGWSKRIIQAGRVSYMEKEVEGLKQLFSVIDDSSLYEVIGNIYDNPELLDNSELLEDKP